MRIVVDENIPRRTVSELRTRGMVVIARDTVLRWWHPNE